MAEIGVQNPAYTTVCVLTDKEETGSDGVTGLNSMYTFHFLQQLCQAQGADYITACKAAKCLSADVTAAFDPTFADAFEPDNGTYAATALPFTNIRVPAASPAPATLPPNWSAT